MLYNQSLLIMSIVCLFTADYQIHDRKNCLFSFSFCFFIAVFPMPITVYIVGAQCVLLYKGINKEMNRYRLPSPHICVFIG